MNIIQLIQVSAGFNQDTGRLSVLEDISIRVEKNEFVSIVGPSGCGKSTLFNLICGFIEPTVGKVILKGRENEKKTDLLSYMPQKDLLLPWRKIIDNVTLSLKISGQLNEQTKKESLGMMRFFGLEGFENCYPGELSGGMRQRAALMRTFLAKKEIMLLDEPFGALDAITRFKMQTWLLDIWQRYQRSILFITHDVEEAVYLSDRIYVLSERPGRVIKEIKVTLPRPRTTEMLVTSEFSRIKNQVLQKIFC